MTTAGQVFRLLDDSRLKALSLAITTISREALRMIASGKLVARPKPDGSPVTNVDLLINEKLTETLLHDFPDIGILSEESGETGSQNHRWIIDPVDGTWSLVRGLPGWQITVALEEEGEIVLAVAYDPLAHRWVYAKRGHGTWVSGLGLNTTQLRHTHSRVLSQANLIVVNQPSLITLQKLRNCDPTSLINCVGQCHNYGDSDNTLYISDGRADLMVLANVGLWDLAPLQLFVEEAGGKMTDLSGNRTIQAEHALLSNGDLHREALGLINTRAQVPR